MVLWHCQLDQWTSLWECAWVEGHPSDRMTELWKEGRSLRIIRESERETDAGITLCPPWDKPRGRQDRWDRGLLVLSLPGWTEWLEGRRAVALSPAWHNRGLSSVTAPPPQVPQQSRYEALHVELHNANRDGSSGWEGLLRLMVSPGQKCCQG